MDLIEKTLVDYINEVDSLKSAPGGGSVAALVGALGVSLAKMLGHFTMNKKVFKNAEKRSQNQFLIAFDTLNHYKDLLIKGVDDDAISYNAVVEALKTKDDEKIQKSINYSTFVAFEMQQSAYNALICASRLIKLGNKYLYSDLISSAILLHSSNEMASLNVKANAKMLNDEKTKNNYISESDALVASSLKLKKKMLKLLNN